MKHILIAFFSFVLGISAILPLGALSPAQAQTQPGTLPGDVPDISTQPGVAFVKGDRGILYIKRPNAPVDAYKIDSLVTSITSGQYEFDSIRHLAVIGMMPNSSRIILGGAVYFKDPLSNGLPAVFEGIFRLPWPLNATTIGNDLPFDGSTSKPRWFLQGAPDPGSFHPSGILSTDGSQWYAAMRTSSPQTNTMTFYHGHVQDSPLDGMGTVDSAVITADVAGTPGAPEGGWIMSNIGLDTTNGTMLVAEVDALESIGNQGERYLLIHWNPSLPPQNAGPYATALDINGLSGSIQISLDSIFALTVVPLQDRSRVNIGLKNISRHDNSIEFYTTRYDVTTTSLAPSGTNGLIPNSILPDGTTFFAGINTSVFTPTYHDDNDLFHEHGQSGDVIITPDGTSALFDTHEVPDNPSTTGESPRNVKSAIYTYDFSEAKAKLIYNDSTAQELQPIFVPSKDTIPHIPDIQANATVLDFGTKDTGMTSAKTLTITDPSTFDGTILDSARITSDAEFTIVSPKFPDTLKEPNPSVQIQVLFTPVIPAGLKNATLKIYSAMSATTSVSVSLSGTSAVKTGGGGIVTEDPSLAQNMSVSPNPFSSIASVRLTARDAGALGIVVHDALGRTVYTSPVIHVGVGTPKSFDFDAKSLGLPNGIYYVTALFGDRQVSRQVVYVR
ncbi:MAG TPA: hypothetical protein VFD13_06585 [Candidatus Kapabacteria bacterium]|nr:hypothetical protein [Candidatus Kapabacteria bacterium]